MAEPVQDRQDTETRAFWDKNAHITEDPTYWMADRTCRETINRRVSGNPHAWPLQAFQQHIGRRFRRGLSLGCGLGSLERDAIQLELCEEIEGIDASEASVETARSRAIAEGVDGRISYRVGNLNSLTLERSRYDVVFFHASLHHVRSVEKLLGRVERALTLDGLLFLDEWVGPSRTEWDDESLARMRALYADLPASWRAFTSLQYPVALDDPSEAVRSSAIVPSIHRLFRVIHERPYGGHLVAIILYQLAHDRVPKADRQALIEKLLQIEDADLARDPSCSFHTVIVAGRKGGGARAIGHVRNFLVRLGLAWRYRIPAALGHLRRSGQRFEMEPSAQEERS